MKANGKCCFEAAGVALAVANGAPVSQIGRESATMVDKAKENIITNIVQIAAEGPQFSVAEEASERQRQATKMWTEVLATSADNLMNQVCEGKTWGGYVELAAALWHSDTEIVIAHAEEIHAQATESEVEAGIYPAMLAGLPSGTAKKRRVFVVLSGQHYHVGKVTAGGTTRVIFEIGKEADEAQSHIVAYLKSQPRARSRPCTLMKCGSKSERPLPNTRGSDQGVLCGQSKCGSRASRERPRVHPAT